MARFDVEIDALTRSVVLARTGRSIRTRIVDWGDLGKFQRAATRPWRFDWSVEAKQPGRRIAALLLAHSEVVQGLVCFEAKDDHVHAHLIESAPHNIGAGKMYVGVPGNLIAYLCRESHRLGFDGFVAFDAKTELLDHYTRTLSARRVGRSQRMIIDDEAAGRLIEQYFRKGDEWA